MYPIRQSTAVVLPFFAMDSNGDAVTSLSSGDFSKYISKNGGSFSALVVTITELGYGWYKFTLDTGHTDTTGIMTIVFTHASIKQVNLQYRVSARINDDFAFPATAGRSILVTAAGYTAPDLDSAIGSLAKGTEITGFNDISATNAQSAALAAVQAYALSAGNFATDAITSATLAASAGTELATAVWAASTRKLTATALSAGIFDSGFITSAAFAANVSPQEVLDNADLPSDTEMDLKFAALNDLGAADVWGHAIDATGATQEAGDALMWVMSYAAGRIVNTTGNIYVYYAYDSSTALFTNNIATAERTRS